MLEISGAFKINHILEHSLDITYHQGNSYCNRSSFELTVVILVEFDPSVFFKTDPELKRDEKQ